ncbi:MAG: hypothetical protein JWP38_1738 [Herbaspirillum sp.]|nr:hypothetical protein [Herbaspirillum sp.]
MSKVMEKQAAQTSGKRGVTQDQLIRCEYYSTGSEKWIRIGLSTEPANRGKTEAVIKGLYTRAKLKEPKLIWLPSCSNAGEMPA